MKDAQALLAAAEADAAARGKGWVTLDTLRAALAALPPQPPPLPPPPPTVHGLDAQGWYDTALRYHRILHAIAHTHGHGVTADWLQYQALVALGEEVPTRALAIDGTGYTIYLPDAPRPPRIEKVAPDAAAP
jgi:hypothetical protein